jgi:hypothetical protein
MIFLLENRNPLVLFYSLKNRLQRIDRGSDEYRQISTGTLPKILKRLALFGISFKTFSYISKSQSDDIMVAGSAAPGIKHNFCQILAVLLLPTTENKNDDKIFDAKSLVYEVCTVLTPIYPF